MPAPSRSRRIGFPESAEVPVYLTPLVGRDADVAEVCRLLRVSRLVSLVGAGGSGKTRLAGAVAAELRRRHSGGVAWIDLAPLSDAGVVACHAAATLGVREQPCVPAADCLIELIGTSAVLLVLDNCEHLLGASASLADALLRGCPALRIVTTSRQALGIPGEKAWLVPPLALPEDDASARQSPAVQLFVQRASDAMRGFELTDANTAAVAHICRRLDGLPLAIELAAARVKLLPPAQLAARLDSMLSLLATGSEQRLARHRTLRALIGWSYELLSAEERRLLGRLAVFAGGFTLDAAERVAGDESLASEHVIDLLAGLIDKSLVTAREWQGEARFGLLETVRQYAWQATLDGEGVADDVAALRARHATYFVELAETAEPHILGGTRGTPWMTRLEHEHGNVRAALEWCGADADRTPLALRLSAALLWFDFALGHFEEPRRAIQSALDRSGDVPPLVRARALTALGYMALWTGEASGVQAPLMTSVQMLRGSDSHTDLAFALIGLATAAGLGGDAHTAYELFDEAEAALGNPVHFPRDDFPRALLYAFARYWRGSVAMAHGDLALARSSYEAAIAVARSWGSHPSIAHPLAALARVLIVQDELDAAHACLTESLPIHAANDDRWGLIQALEPAALLLARRGRMQAAARVLGATDRMRARSGIRPTPPEQSQLEQLRTALDAELGADGYHTAHADGETMPIARLMALVAGSDGDAGDAPSIRTSPDDEGIRAPAQDATPADLEVRALGPLEVLVGGQPLDGDAFGSSRPRELLLLLLCHPDGRTREQVGLEFWPDSSAAQVKNSFHVTLHRLRKALPHPDWVVIAGDRYRLDPALRIEFDVTVFRDAIEAALRGDATEPAGDLVSALQLYRGDFLEGELVDDWHLSVRDELKRLRQEGLRFLGERRIAEGRFDEAADAFRALLGSDPLDEAACRALMTCHARTGLRVEAIRLYENLSVLLEDQLGVSPARETTDLYRRLQQTEPL
ncbi:MAG TPA: BTAD domain-containing putative transcriptional regulator [Longimicrobiales bacterium]|nr:BTAD domain-containing putative transcriptional regulator [Longimicrobiales bacterium]